VKGADEKDLVKNDHEDSAFIRRHRHTVADRTGFHPAQYHYGATW